MTSRHDEFEGFRDSEIGGHDLYNEDEIYEGVVQHTCYTAMHEMTEIGQIGELIKMFTEVISDAIGKGIASKTVQEEPNPSPRQVRSERNTL
jgi:hypothetical protein